MAQQETRLIVGGIDSDSAPYAMENGSVFNAVNIRGLRKKGQTSGAADWILGNTECTAVTSFLSGGTNTLLGACADDATALLYLFIHNSGGSHIIIEFNSLISTARAVLTNAQVTGGFGWTADMFISCGISNSLLFFCEGAHDIRLANTSVNYTAIAPISQSDLSLIFEPGIVPVTSSRSTVAGAVSYVQERALQFSYRFNSYEGFTSVLSPYSLTSDPPRRSEITANASASNAITITISTQQQIPARCKSVDLVARYMDSGVFYVIKTWDKSNATDLSAINAHNSGTPLALSAWTGDNIGQALDAAYAAKQFDAIPNNAKYLALFANRLGLANVESGQDTPVIKPGFSIAQTTVTTTAATSHSENVYVVSCSIGGGSPTKVFQAFALRDSVNHKTYLLPSDLELDSESSTAAGAITYPNAWQIPAAVHRDYLREVSDQTDPDLPTHSAVSGTINPRLAIIKDALGLADQLDSTTIISGQPTSDFYGTVNIIASVPADTDTGSGARLFVPNTKVDYGIQYYDKALRKCGSLYLGTLTTPANSITSPSYLSYFNFTINNTVSGAIPDFADYYSIVFSPNRNASTIYGFVPNTIKVAMKNRSTGTITYEGYKSLTTPPGNKDVHAIAVPIASLSRYDIGYSYGAGDYMTLTGYGSGGASFDYTAAIIGSADGYIYLAADTGSVTNLIYIIPDFKILSVAGPMTAQKLVYATLFIGTNVPTTLYENASFGIINGSVGSKTFGNFFSSGSLTIRVNGDAFFTSRTASTGAATLYSTIPNEFSAAKTSVNDLGRVAPFDHVGKQTLSNFILYSNARIPGAVINGYASFDANDYKTTDVTAGAITGLALTTRGAQDGGQMLVLCEHGSFAALVGQQQIKGQDGSNAFTSAVNVIGDFNALRGQYGCQSPASIVAYEGKVWWVDAYRKSVIEFNESGAGVISKFKAARLWDSLLAAVVDPKTISAGVNPYTGELLVSLPSTSISGTTLPTYPSLRNPLDAVNGTVRTWCYDWDANRWTTGYTSGAIFKNVGNAVFGFLNGKLWSEFTGTPGSYYGSSQNAMIVIPFNKDYPGVKSPLSLRLSADTAPDNTYIVAPNGVAQTQSYTAREGDLQAPILRNRLSNSAANSGQWDASGINGSRLKGQVVTAVLIYQPTSTPINLSSATLAYDVSSGH